jgi:hypothetical protein
MPFSGGNPMNFKKLPREKKKQLVLVLIVTVALLNGLGFGLIRFQYGRLNGYASKKATAGTRLQQMRDAIKNADRLESELSDARKTLETMEADTASGDLYAWVINTLRTFKAGYKVEMPQFSPIGAVGEVNIIPDFPYKQASLTVAGTAHFHDLGRFIADFENQYPHIRVLNLTLDANPASAAEETETVSFKMEIATLVKSNPS